MAGREIVLVPSHTYSATYLRVQAPNVLSLKISVSGTFAHAPPLNFIGGGGGALHAASVFVSHSASLLVHCAAIGPQPGHPGTGHLDPPAAHSHARPHDTGWEPT